MFFCVFGLIHAEISVYPIGTGTTSSRLYIAKGMEAIKSIKDVRYEINSMRTILESYNIDKIYESAKKIMEVVHNLGVNRGEIILKIDSRNDKQLTMKEKIESIKKHLGQ